MPLRITSSNSWMEKMKRLLLGASLVALSLANPVIAAVGANDIGATAIAQTDCPLLTSDANVKITLSAGNIGSFMCDTSSANIGVAVGNTSGKNKIFSIGSAGGSVTVIPTRAAPTNSDTQNAATTVAGETTATQALTINRPAELL